MPTDGLKKSRTMLERSLSENQEDSGSDDDSCEDGDAFQLTDIELKSVKVMMIENQGNSSSPEEEGKQRRGG